MKATVEQQQDSNVAQIHLTIESEHAAQEYNKACRRLGQRLNIPGFRRGKAPRNIIEKNIGTEKIKQEALDRLLPHAFADIISEHQLDIVAPPVIEKCDFDLQKGVDIKAQVELRPDVKLGELPSAVKVPLFVTPEDSEEKELQAIVERMTTLEPVIDRPCQAEDLVNIDFDGKVNGEAIKGGSAKNYRLDLSNNNFIEGFGTQIVGHSLKESFPINVTFPEDYHDKTLAGKPAEFQIKINEIHRRVVPELSDELAAQVGPYESLEQLKEEIRGLLKQNEESENQYRKQKALIDAVVDGADVNIPESMIKRESNLLQGELQQRFKSQGLSWEDFVGSQGQGDIQANIKEEAIRRIKTSLVFGALAKEQNIEISEADFNAHLDDLVQSRNMDPKMAMKQLANQPAAVQALTDQILAQKVVDYLMNKSTFEFVQESDEPTGDGKGENPQATELAEKIEGTGFDVLDAEDKKPQEA